MSSNSIFNKINYRLKHHREKLQKPKIILYAKFQLNLIQTKLNSERTSIARLSSEQLFRSPMDRRPNYCLGSCPPQVDTMSWGECPSQHHHLRNMYSFINRNWQHKRIMFWKVFFLIYLRNYNGLFWINLSYTLHIMKSNLKYRVNDLTNL